jgi:hypothetical protein
MYFQIKSIEENLRGCDTYNLVQVNTNNDEFYECHYVLIILNLMVMIEQSFHV